MQERRGCVRWQLNRQGQIRLEGAMVYTNCSIQDINFKGLKIALGQHLTLDKFIKMTIMISKEFSFEAEVWVVWHKKVMDTNVYGCYFTRIKDHDKEGIYQFVRKNSPDEFNKVWWKDCVPQRKGDTMTQNGAGEDKRVFSRFVANLAIKLLDLNSNRESEAFTQDISAKGIGILTEEALKPHTPLEMWINVPDAGQPLYSRGEVVWSKMAEANKYRAGVTLEKADLMGMSRILRTI